MNELDLRKDFADVYALVAERVRSFDPATNDGPADEEGPGATGRVGWIELGFDPYQSGWVCLVFDTRADPEPDGEWNAHIGGNLLERPHWAEACAANEEAPLVLILPDGTRQELAADSSDELANAVGEMLRGVLLKARTDGVFSGLPRAGRCELGVEEQDGSYGWPEYEARGSDNLL